MATGKTPFGALARRSIQRLSAAERLLRLEEAKGFLSQHLAASQEPAQTVLKAANVAGLATRTLHRAKASRVGGNRLGVRTARSKGKLAGLR
jgi:hypothetical protein